jgi:hypothetical protein
MTFRVRPGALLVPTCLLLVACGSGGTLKGSGGTGGGLLGRGGATGQGGTPGTLQVTFSSKTNNDLDLLFMIDNSSSMTLMQQKLAAQIPTFFNVLQGLPSGLPNLHVAVVSSDMGAPGDSTSQIGCTQRGDDGMFQYQIGAAATSCNATTLTQGDTFISDVSGAMNFTSPIQTVLQCIAQLGSSGCGFEHQLASIDRALGADGLGSPPATNANFLRADAYLGIVLLTNEDDCSAPSDTTIFSLNGGMQSISNPDGPIANYRCNGGPRGAHLCKDAGGKMIVPPLTPPADATGNPPILNLTDCEDNEGGSSALIPVNQFVADIKKLKPDPDHQIMVAAITAPPDPYGVVWVPPASPPPGASGQLWPQVMHSCGAQGGDDVNPLETQSTADGTFGDPGVRVTQFVNGFADSVIASVCDASYASAMTEIAAKLGQLVVGQGCVTGYSTLANPKCTVVNHVEDSTGKVMDVAVPNCSTNGSTPPCWAFSPSSACTNADPQFKLTAAPAAAGTTTFSTLTCTPG